MLERLRALFGSRTLAIPATPSLVLLRGDKAVAVLDDRLPINSRDAGPLYRAAKKVMLGKWFVGAFWRDERGVIVSLGMETDLVRSDGRVFPGHDGREEYIASIGVLHEEDELRFRPVWDESQEGLPSLRVIGLIA